MTVDEARCLQDESERQALRLKKMLSEYDAAKEVLSNLAAVQYAGKMEFVGTSGRIGDNTPILSVNINDIGGCVKVPALIRELAEKKCKDIEAYLAGAYRWMPDSSDGR